MHLYHRLLRMKLKDLQERLRQAIALVDELLPANELAADALRLACELGSSSCDAAYLAAAKRRQAGILSLDRRINEAAARLGIRPAGDGLRP